jgi:hypothetical protein
MKQILGALCFLLMFCAQAWAQGCGPTNPNCIVPTAPPGTSDNRAASTAFVQQAVTGPPSNGMVGDGFTDNTTVFQGLLTTAGTNGGSINLSCGNFVIKGATTLTVAPARSATVVGQGLCTILSFQGADATAITLGDKFASIRWGHMRLTTNGAGTHAGLVVFMQSNPVPLFEVHHTFENMQFTGDDYNLANPPTHWWSTALSITDLSLVNIDNVTIVGGGTGAPGTGRNGTGVLLKGIAATGSVGVIYNFKNFVAIYTNVGLEYGEYAQGVSIVASNFQSSNYGIRAQPTAFGVSELAVVNSQFGDNTVAGISVGPNMAQLMVSNSLFEVGTTTGTSGGAAQTGIMGIGGWATITGNNFADPSSLPPGLGIGIALTSTMDSMGFGTITGNVFTSLQYGITADASATYSELVVSKNVHVGFPAMYNITGGTNIFIDDSQANSVAGIPACSSAIFGSTMTIVDNATAPSYRGDVTGGGTLGWGRVFCLPTSLTTGKWVQN